MKVKISKQPNDEIVNKYPYFLEYLDRTLQVHVKYIHENKMANINKKARSGKWVKHQRVEEIDPKVFNSLLMKEALVDIENLTWQSVKYLIEPHIKLELDGAKWTDEAKFDEELKDLIVENVNYSFFSFLQDKARDAETIVNALEEEETKNLKTGSGTAKKALN